MTVEEFAERAGLSPDYVGKVEQGLYVPSAETLVRIAKGLGVEPGDLFPPRGGRDTAAKRRALDELLGTATQLTERELVLLRELARALMRHRA